MPGENTRCPKCWLTDRVQKVASVYTPPVAGLGDVQADGQAAIYQKLAPPRRPARPRLPGLMTALAAVSSLIGGVSLIIGLWDRSAEIGTPEYGTIVAAGRAFAIAGGLAIVVGIFVAIPVIMTYQRVWRKFGRENASWERRMAVWNRLCYCTRDHGVFLPGHNEFLPAEQIHVLISRYAGQSAGD